MEEAFPVEPDFHASPQRFSHIGPRSKRDEGAVVGTPGNHHLDVHARKGSVLERQHHGRRGDEIGRLDIDIGAGIGEQLDESLHGYVPFVHRAR